MRKLCLSGCFKRKMSKARENIWQAIIGTVVALLGTVVIFAAFAGTGWALSLIWPTIETRYYIPSGLSFYIGLGVLWWFGWLLSKAYKKVTSETFKLVKEKYENNYETCSIFEYCDAPEEAETETKE